MPPSGDEEPLALDRVWLPVDLAAPLLGSDFTYSGLYAELASHAGIRLDHGREDVRTVIPALAEQARLRCPPGAAAFSINRLGHTRDRPAEWRHALVRGDWFALTARFSTVTGYQLIE